MNKTRLNYRIDLVISPAFAFSAVSGIIFLFPVSDSTILGISYNIWDQIHTWGSLLMITGVLAHLTLHWRWIVAMTRKTLFNPATLTHTKTTAANGVAVSRRQFLRTAGMGAVALGAAAVGYKSLFGNDTADENEAATDSSTVETSTISIPLTILPAQETSTQSSQIATACPKGLTYDPYPGKCHHYIDSNGGGYCDYSVPSAT